jgi:phosphatidylserine/phosphatidylglycerophosphate/cardiolipin synthase-like enzyme
LLLTGAPAADVEHNIRQRWAEADMAWWSKLAPPLKHLAQSYMPENQRAREEKVRAQEKNELRDVGPDLPGSAARVQVVRTIPALTYRFAPAGINTIAEAYINAIHHARQFVYLETQYLWLEGFYSISTPGLGWESRYMRALFAEMVAAANRGVTIAMLLPDHPNIGRPVTDSTIERLLHHAPKAVEEGRLRFFCLASSQTRAHDNLMRYRPVYVHAKVGIVDDQWTTIGSANLNSRGMSHDAELNVAVLDEEFSRGLRISLWAEHLGVLQHAHAGWPQPACIALPGSLCAADAEGLLTLVEEIESWLDPAQSATKPKTASAANDVDLKTLEDPIAGLDLLTRRAADNLELLRKGRPLVGQLLPYLRHGESKAAGLNVNHARGLLDPMRGVREGVKVRHPRRYI